MQLSRSHGSANLQKHMKKLAPRVAEPMKEVVPSHDDEILE